MNDAAFSTGFSSGLSAVASLFWSFVVPLAIQALVLLLAAGLLDRLLPRTVWPELRLAVGLVLFLKLLLPPALASPTSLLSRLSLPLPAALTPGWIAPVEDHWRTTAVAAAILWLAGVVLALGLRALGSRRLETLWKRAAPPSAALTAAFERAAARIGTARSVGLRSLPELDSPFVFGTFRTRILVPDRLEGRDAEHALLHELAHVRRGDLALAAFVDLVRALYWFHPLVHLAARRLADLRELCCDRVVARHLGAETPAYRSTLLGFAARRHRHKLATLAFTGRSSLLERLRALERAERDRPALRRGLTALAALLALGCAAPMAPRAEERAAAVAEMINRPPGCLQLRFLVLGRLAEEQRRAQTPASEEP